MNAHFVSAMTEATPFRAGRYLMLTVGAISGRARVPDTP